MNQLYLNAEGYPDPTAYEAITRIEHAEKDQSGVSSFRPLVYICSPYAGNIERNVSAARMYCRFAVDQGCIPIAPHLLFPQFMRDGDPKERELALFFGNVLMSKCAEVWVFGETFSPGMTAEIERAAIKRYPIRFFDTNMKEVTNHA